ncbi:hypothetical protein DPEC_G00315560 [Dallia pectoralis]|uniref:Uncharacterized protein n=1 Tax=Dallia pectoralis TaxID=75939 RepID=A0ACC2FCI9_DALPE|nr:hypothetical protein DPEC_G00315560 [Dallia pectoralis]
MFYLPVWPPVLKYVFFPVFLTEQLKPGLQIPCPAELMGKILIKNKKGSMAKTNQASPKKTAGLDQPSVTTNPGQTPGQDVPASPEDQCLTEKNKSYLISSFVETKGESMISKSAVEFVERSLLYNFHSWNPAERIYSGQFLSDKTVKTGVEVEIIGLPGDPKKKFRTKWSSTPNAINPVWNEEPFVFEKILLPDMASLRVVVFEEGGRFLGHRIIPIEALQSGFQHINLRSENNTPLTLPALFVYIEVKDYIPAAFADFTDALFNPTKNSEKTSKTTESSADYVSPYEMPLVNAEQTVVAAPKDIVNEDDTATGSQANSITAEEAPPEAPDPDMDSPSQSPTAVEPIQSADEAPENVALRGGPELDPEPATAAELTSDPNVDVTSPPNPSIDGDSILDVSPDAATHPDPDVDSAPLADPGVAPVSSPEAGLSSLPNEDPTPLDTNTELSTVPCEELLQHKSFLKVTKRQEKDMKELEKKSLKKGEELIQKYSDTFKGLKKKNSLRKKEGGGETAESGPKADRVREYKEKMQVELRALWVEQCDQLRKKKEQQATESADSSPQHDALVKKQTATLDQIKGLANQLNLEALAESEKRMRSLPVDIREAVNTCVRPHFPDLVDQAAEKQQDGVCVYGNVFLG